MYRGFS